MRVGDTFYNENLWLRNTFYAEKLLLHDTFYAEFLARRSAGISNHPENITKKKYFSLQYMFLVYILEICFAGTHENVNYRQYK